ncbi:YopT-type cysteine protease domain-containing protein [Pelagibaculum spongiae]|uniref:Peptidase C58 YopT-type domain-containing protein n=1 Tax=Pelagibaculum spongiae TaxID=2080658 RepID=A0A2V1GWL5_9GAMM|nr:YopT-type cysteine protease domain-containing protein [Pelagibaculum spongiae]PVZ68338.1 hypothetical protein DC094_13720 [Pelagibaculum spongiae]
MSYEIFKSIAENNGGVVSTKFDQGSRLAGMHYIRARSIFGFKKKKMVTSNLNGLDGMCFGFSMVLIQKSFNFPSFMRLINTPEGKGKVRGYMQMQNLRAATKTGKLQSEESIYANVERGEISLVNNFADIGTLVLHKDYQMVGKVSYNAGKLVNSALFIRNNPDCYFHLNVYGASSGHALAMVNTDNDYAIFDPNFGIAKFSKSGRGSTRSFCKFIDLFIKLVYQGGLTGHHELYAYRSRNAPKATIRI